MITSKNKNGSWVRSDNLVYDVYTIEFSKSGVLQYADFNVNAETEELLTKSFHVDYQKPEEIPSLENAHTIEDALKIIKDYSYNNKAKLFKKNGMPISVNYSKVTESKILFEETISKVYSDTWNSVIVPLLNDQNWTILNFDLLIDNQNIESYSDLYNQINYMCYSLLKSIDACKTDKFENGYIKNYIPIFLCKCNYELLHKKNLFKSF